MNAHASESRDERRRVVVITGASGGIGRSLVESLLDERVDLYLVARSRLDELNELTRRLSEDETKARARVFQADLSVCEESARLATRILDALREDQNDDAPRIDALVLAAGIDLMARENKALDFDARLQKAWQVDVASNITIARALCAIMRARSLERASEPRPSALFFGWSGVERGQKGETSQIYAACKGAIVAFARSLAQELAPYVRVNTINPGWIKTTWGEQASEAADRRARRDSLLQRWGTAREVAALARFLISDEASFINGVDANVDGGFAFDR